MGESLDILIIGPAHPYRGGIATTNHELGLALEAHGKEVKILTFSKLYPKFLFPGKTQFETEQAPPKLSIKRGLYAFHPWTWKTIRNTIIQWRPKTVLFRYYTPFLAPCYTALAKGLPSSIKCIGLVDNWTPHEQKPWDTFLNRRFGKQMDGFATLSQAVADEIKSVFKTRLWAGFHPIAKTLPMPISKTVARKALGWDQQATIVLFFGLIRKYKGLDLLLKAFATFPLKETKIQLAIVGEFYEPKQRYMDLIEQLKLQNRVILYPEFADNQRAQNVFCAADAVAQTYHSATQSGVTPLAYHYNTPILVTDLPGLKAPIEADHSGLVTTPDPKTIAKQLVALLNKKQLETFRKNIKKATPNYQWEEFAKKLIAFSENKITLKK